MTLAEAYFMSNSSRIPYQTSMYQKYRHSLKNIHRRISPAHIWEGQRVCVYFQVYATARWKLGGKFSLSRSVPLVNRFFSCYTLCCTYGSYQNLLSCHVVRYTGALVWNPRAICANGTTLRPGWWLTRDCGVKHILPNFRHFCLRENLSCMPLTLMIPRQRDSFVTQFPRESRRLRTYEEVVVSRELNSFQVSCVCSRG